MQAVAPDNFIVLLFEWNSAPYNMLVLAQTFRARVVDLTSGHFFPPPTLEEPPLRLVIRPTMCAVVLVCYVVGGWNKQTNAVRFRQWPLIQISLAMMGTTDHCGGSAAPSVRCCRRFWSLESQRSRPLSAFKVQLTAPC